ncbi:MAG: type II toxin-antitoxin system RelE/ParE family toxin [Candidatus Omnitrophota bacterium]
MIREVRYYCSSEGKQPFEEWLLALSDRRIQSRILTRCDRLLTGNFGDTKLVDTGIWELRFHFGPGYRVYFGLDGRTLVILLCGGDKSTQEGDIRRARAYWMDYLRRK